MTAAGFGNWFRRACDAAGLAERSAHGLRHAKARLLAEAGATPHEIQAITVHESLAEVQRYTKAAEQARLARAGSERLERERSSGHSAIPDGKLAENSNDFSDFPKGWRPLGDSNPCFQRERLTS